MFVWPVRIYYEDTDSGGVVYHANFLKFMERARTEWLRSLGFEQDAMRLDLSVIYVVHSAQLDFLRPARFNDQLEVTVEVAHIGGTSITFAQEVWCGDTLACRGQVRIVSLDADTFRPRPSPAAVVESLQNVMENA